MPNLFPIFIGEWVFFFLFIYLITYRHGGKIEITWSREHLKNQYWFIFTVIGCLFVVLLQGVFPEILASRLFPGSTLLDYLGLGINTLGLIFAGWARMILNKNWSNMIRITSDQNLVRTGPYRFIRNPMYSGVILALIGSTIASNRVFMLLLIIIVIIGIWIKLKDEEQLLLREFGDEYAGYMRETKALIPYIL